MQEPLNRVDANGHIWANQSLLALAADAEADYACGWCQSHPTAASQGHANQTHPANTQTTGQTQPDQGQQAQQHYGRQPDGSYKADPARVRAAIAAKKPIIEPGGDGKAECVAACKFLSGAPSSGQWTEGPHPQPALGLNDTTDVGLAIATFDKSGKFNGNSGIYMGHDPKTGGIMIVDQWPDNGPKYDHPWQHTLDNHGSEPAMSGDAYYVIHVP